MKIRKIGLTNFRNLRNTSIEIAPGGSFIIGRNGQGKTNLLEAIYYLGTMRSFRTRRDSDLVRFGETYMRLEGEYESAGGEGKIEVGYGGGRKVVKLNGARPERIRDAFGCMKVVIVTPDDVELVRTFPAARRKFMDIVLSLTSRVYLETLARYQEALSQRNALLRTRGSARESIAAWNAELARLASGLATRRKIFLEEFSTSYRNVHGWIDPATACELEYRTSPREAVSEMAGAAEDHVAQFYEDALRASYERDRELGMTSTGPHRDDILMRLDGKDLRTYGSQGQHRTAVFSLRMAEAKYVEEKSGEIPILLMDDVFSQLDTERGGRLMDLVRGVYQTMITAPREEHARYPLEGLARMDVKNGEIRIADGP